MSRRAMAESVVAACRDAGTTHLFGVPGGGSNLDVVGAAAAAGIEFVLVHTETAATVMAGVMGELTGAPGMAVATRGPGAASAVNGMAQALLDRQPVVLVTDSVSSADWDRVSHQRLAQQALMAPVAKATTVLDGSDPAAAASVVGVALDAPAGPVHIDFDPSAEASSPVPAPTPTKAQSDAGFEAVLRLARSARKPVIIAGVGAVSGRPGERAAVVAAIDVMGRDGNVPVLCTYKARGVVADAAPWCAGIATGATIESPVLQEADLIIGVGLDPVEFIPAAWPYAAPLVSVGSWAVSDSVYFGHHLAAEAVGQLGPMTQQLAAVVESAWAAGDGQSFRQQANNELLAVVPDQPRGLTPQQVVTIASSVAPMGTIATVDAGAHMLVTMPLWEVDAPGQLLISSGLATMGFALPAAVAASLASPARSVVCFTGDGGIGMALAELETLARLALPVVVVVFNDSLLSLIAAKQQPEGHGGAAAVTYSPIDFAAVARGCGLGAQRVNDAGEYEAALTAALVSGVPTLLDVAVDPSAYGAVLDAIRGRRA